MKRMSALLAFVLAAAAATQAQAPVTTWNIDPSHTAASFAVKHMMVSTVRGSLGKVTGTVQYDGKDLNTLQVDVTIDVAAINTQNEGRDKHLRSPDFFEVEKFPTMTFKSKKAAPAGDGKFKLVGDLTMKGVTKEVTLDVEGPSQAIVAQGATRIGASASTTLNRQDYGVKWSRNIDGGGVVVGDEVKVNLELELVKRAAQPGSAQ
jgi:polyisoprenoid-binding protein YceI